MSHSSIVRRGVPEKKPGRTDRHEPTSRAPQLPERSNALAHEHWALGEDRPLLPSLLKMMSMSGAPLVQRKAESGGVDSALESWMDYETRPLEAPSAFWSRSPVRRPEARGGQRALLPIQREAEGAPQVEGDMVQRAADLGTQGGASDVPYRSEMEQAFGADFSGVKSFTGGTAAMANQALGAKAYTMGDAVVFRDSSPDKQTVGHELTHVLQQRAGQVATPQGKGGIINADSSLETEADRAGDAVARGESVKRQGSSAASGTPVSVIQRAVDGRNPDVSWETIHRFMWPDSPAYLKRQPDKDKDNNKLKKKKSKPNDVPGKPKPGPQDMHSPDVKPPKIQQPEPPLAKLILPATLVKEAARLANHYHGYKEVFLSQWIKKEQQQELRSYAKEVGDVEGSLKHYKTFMLTLKRHKKPEKDPKLRSKFEQRKSHLEGHVLEAQQVEQALGARRQLGLVKDVASSYPENRGRIPSHVKALEKVLLSKYDVLGEALRKHRLAKAEAGAMHSLTKSIHQLHAQHTQLSKQFRLTRNWNTKDHLSPTQIETGPSKPPKRKSSQNKNPKQVAVRPRWR